MHWNPETVAAQLIFPVTKHDVSECRESCVPATPGASWLSIPVDRLARHTARRYDWREMIRHER
jgi:hypothetical protein